MADSPFLAWAHALVTGSATRTIVQRATDVFNVRDYFQTGDGSNWRPAIQRAVNAALAGTGGTIFFPPGTYPVDSKIYVGPSGSNKNLMFLGCGGLYSTGGTGSTITTTAADYILYSSMLGTAGHQVFAIDGLTFENTNSSATIPTQIEPPSNPDGVGFSGNGLGCVYIGGGIGTSVRNCNFNTNLGVGFFHAGFQGSVENCNFAGGFNGGDSILESIGIMARSLHIKDCKISNFGHGIACFKGHSQLEFMNIQNCGTGILIGSNPVAYQDSNEVGPPDYIPALIPAGNNACAAPGVYINNIGMESIGTDAFIKCQVMGQGEIRNISMQSYAQYGIPDYGLYCSGSVYQVKFVNIDASGAYDIAAIKVDAGQFTTEFDHCSARQSGGAGVAWSLPSTRMGNMSFKNCFEGDGGYRLNASFPLSVLPAGGEFGEEMKCSNSGLAFSTANVGKAILPTSSTGINKVTVRYSALATTAATASFTTSSATVSIASGITEIVPGMVIWDMSIAHGQARVGTVKTYVGTTLTIGTYNDHTVAGNSEINSAGAADTLAFGAWTIAG